jgi:hypothetical protein
MKNKLPSIVLLALVILSIFDGTFTNPTPLGVVRLIVIGIGLVLQLIVWKKERGRK